MRIRELLLLVAAIGFTACSVPPKQQPAASFRPRANPAKAAIPMSDPAATDYFVKDVSDSLEGGTWRWGFERPEFRFLVKDTAGKKAQVHFTVAEATFKTTGPVTVKFFVNNKLLGTMAIKKSGPYVFEKDVPAEMLKTDEFDTIAIEARPVWVAPTDGKILTVILSQAGFV